MKKSAFLKAVIGCAFVLALSTASFAQKQERGDGEKHVQKLKTELQLSDEQTAKVQAAMQKRGAQMEAIKEGGKKGKKENRDKMKTAMDECDAEMKTILTPEQYAKFDGLRDDKKEKMKEKAKEKRKEKRGNKQDN